MIKHLVTLRKSFKYFNENKTWIISVLFICSVIKESIWYACFGVNILAYISIQDTFISFFNYLLLFVVLILNYVFWAFISLKDVDKRFEKIMLGLIKTTGLILFSGLYFLLFKRIVSLIGLLFIIYIFIRAYDEKEYAYMLGLSLMILLGLSTIEPIGQYHLILNDDEGQNTKGGMAFILKDNNTDYYSFIYDEKLFDTSTFRYYLVGNTSSYFFIFDKEKDETLIIPKSDCTDIKSPVFNLANYFN